jgi:tRNA (guanine37-N1)-methyltransferase
MQACSGAFMRIDLLTLFPEVCEPFFSSSIMGRARSRGLVEIHCHNLRDFTQDPHLKVDDRPFGGGPGMVLMCQRVLLTPQGQRLTQAIVEELAACPRLLLIAGHYEGFDERIRTGLSPREISIGDYVLSGGESAAMVLVDAIVRLVPGVLGDQASACEESFARPTDGEPRGLEYPQYTRPREFRGMGVPEVLTGGDHGKIRDWRREQARERTRQRRPDLLDIEP